LEAWLDFHRATLINKCAGLTDDQLKTRSCPPSSISLLGLVRHMVEVEHGWFAGLAGERGAPRYYSDERPDDDFDALDSHPVDEVFAAYQEECERSRQRVAGRALDDTFALGERTFDLRGILLHMIEEYARHNGHADLIREAIDGSTGT
jgi:uncharacterized damage-inducible protein DinB